MRRQAKFATQIEGFADAMRAQLLSPTHGVLRKQKNVHLHLDHNNTNLGANLFKME